MATLYNRQDTIAAQATPVGSGGVGIVRVSGALVPEIMHGVLGRELTPRFAYYGDFWGEEAGAPTLIDRGIAIYFPAPNSFTGEDVLELQGHGGHIVMQFLLSRVLALGARMAQPGEFSYRAFMNGKMDLTQAEAIADLISASSELAAKQAIRSLQGEFARLIYTLIDRLARVRAELEHALDFTEEELPIGAEMAEYRTGLLNGLMAVSDQIKTVLIKAQLGAKIQEGIKVAIVGKPNAGKSTLFNYLCGCERAIVTDIPGTTRDLLRATVQLKGGLQIELVDTAGFRDNPDQVEAMGINLAKRELQIADHIIYVIDACQIGPDDGAAFVSNLPANTPVTMIYNKIDLLPKDEHGVIAAGLPRQLAPFLWKIGVSFKSGVGVEQLMEHLYKQLAPNNLVDTAFSARERDVIHLKSAAEHIALAISWFQQNSVIDWVLLAEELRLVHVELSAIVGQDSTEALLNQVFSGFCVGK